MIPMQDEADLSKPEEHFLWALHNLPTIAGTGALCHPDILKGWSKHLVACGFVHRSSLEKLADEDGNIHVSQLPEQTIKKVPAIRGPRHAYNNAAAWVPVDSPEPPKSRIPDVRQFTIQENHAIASQLEEIGVIKTPPPPQHKAQELNEGH